MIHAVEEERSLSVEQVQSIIDDTFDGSVKIKDVGDGYRILEVRQNSTISAAPPAEFASETFRRLAGFCITAAESLDIASGYSPEIDLVVGRDDRRFIQVPGFEDVEMVVHNTCGDNELAVQKARECLASLTVGRAARSPYRQPEEPTGGVRISKADRHEFDIEGLVDIRLVVMNQVCPIEAEREAQAALRGLGVRM